jgi:hypothetical protein
MGIPTTPMVTQAFRELAILNVAKRGMPRLRITCTPDPVASKTPEQLRAYIEGDDPVSAKPMMKEIVDALTEPLNQEEKKTGLIRVSVGPEHYGPDTPKQLQQFYHDNGMTDFLPIIIPTRESVERILPGGKPQLHGERVDRQVDGKV